MAGKIVRRKLYDDIINRSPVLARIAFKKLPPAERIKNHADFVESVALGLWYRLMSRNNKEAEVLHLMIVHLETEFQSSVRREGIEQARQRVITTLERTTIPTMKQMLQPNPIQLAREASELTAAMPSKHARTKREKWAAGHGLSDSDAADNDSYLIELILAKRHRMSESRIHKLLAQSSRFRQR